MRKTACLLLYGLGSLCSAQTLDIQGHRGCRGLMPENTIPAFLKAMDLGVQTLELDVVISKDSQVVVSHDAYLNARFALHPDGRPVTQTEAPSLVLFTMDYAMIQQFDMGKRQNPSFPEQTTQAAIKPLLRQVIQTCDAYARQQGLALPRYSIEIKSAPSQYGFSQPSVDVFCSLVYGVLQPLLPPDRFIIQSFDFHVLRFWKAQQRMQVFGSNELSALVTHQSFTKTERQLGFRPDIFSPYYRFVSRRKVRKTHQKGVKIIPWTVNSFKKMLRFKKIGVDGFITDFPNRAKKL